MKKRSKSGIMRLKHRKWCRSIDEVSANGGKRRRKAVESRDVRAIGEGEIESLGDIAYGAD